MRVRQLWAPVLSTWLISVSVQFVALRVPQSPPWVFFTRNGVSIVLAPLWMLALPFIGALGAWLSRRAGGNTRDRLLTALGPAWLMGGIMTLGVALSPIIERHFSPSIKLTCDPQISRTRSSRGVSLKPVFVMEAAQDWRRRDSATRRNRAAV